MGWPPPAAGAARGAARASSPTRPSPRAARAGGGGAGKAESPALPAPWGDERGLTAFRGLLPPGHHTTAASLIGAATSDGVLREAYRINLADVVVTGVQEDQAGGFSVTLH